MKKGLSEIVLVLDRSGSMSSTKTDAEGGLREFIRKQKLLPGECNVTFYRFDNEIERVFDSKPIERVEEGELKLEPRGSTALFDAMAQAIDEVGRRLKATEEDRRPETVYFVTITDGYENCSRLNSQSQVFDRVTTQRDKFNWQFIYIGANQDAIATAAQIGITPKYSLSYNGNPNGIGTWNAYNSLTSNVTRARQYGVVGQSMAFTQEEQNQSMEE